MARLDYRSADLACFIKNYSVIKENAGRISTGESSPKITTEKNAQQKLVMQNNANQKSAWYCTDIEYTQSQMDDGTPGFGRFDMVALSRKPENGKYKIALVELKVGTAAFPSSIKTDYKNESKKAEALEVKEKIEANAFDIAVYNGSLGSGILGHFADFYRFMLHGQFEQLREETCGIINAKSKLKDRIGETDFPYGRELKPDDISEEPEYHFVTLCTSQKKDAVIRSFRNYLLEGKEASTLTVEKVFSQSHKWEDLKRYQIHFHFTEKQESAIDDFLGEPEEDLLPKRK